VRDLVAMSGLARASFGAVVRLIADRFFQLADPETRDKLKLPEFISDLRIENGQLLITEK